MEWYKYTKKRCFILRSRIYFTALLHKTVITAIIYYTTDERVTSFEETMVTASTKSN